MKFSKDFWREVLEYQDNCVAISEPITIDGIMSEFNVSNRVASGIYTFLDNIEYIVGAFNEDDYNGVNENENIVDDLESKTPTDEELIEASVRYKKQTQRFQDTNRIERKSFREFARIENALTALDSELFEILKNTPVINDLKFIKTENPSCQSVGIIHLTDLHFNELVDISVNKYDFKIASKRLKKFIQTAIKYFESEKVDKVFIAMTGDMLNNDNLLDKILNQASNRAKAIFLAHKLLTQAVLELASHFKIVIGAVTGNETRLKGDITFDTKIASDNFDFMLYNMLYATFQNCERVSFAGCDTELVVEIAGQNVLLLHGHQRRIMANVTSGIQQIIGKYAQRGIVISFVLFGHVHEAYCADIFARGSSMVGANSYSEDGLQLASRASQNLHIFYSDGGRNTIRVDLQSTDNMVGYEIDEDLEAYNAKSVDKLHENTVIFKVVI